MRVYFEVAAEEVPLYIPFSFYGFLNSDPVLSKMRQETKTDLSIELNFPALFPGAWKRLVKCSGSQGEEFASERVKW